MGDFVEAAVCRSCGVFIYPAGHPMLGRKGGGIEGEWYLLFGVRGGL